MHLFGEGFGAFTVEKSLDRNLFLLPVISTLGKEVVDSMKVYPDREIPDPRSLSYLKIEIDGIRAANIDVSASNKEVLSVNPVIFGIHRSPLKAEGNLFEKEAVKDTTLLGISDYIQSKDARILRTAKRITSKETDTLEMAHIINRWVFTSMRKDPYIQITRSIDVLRNMKGGWDEHTKLFTALTRSIGIPTRILTGFVYDDKCFRYHSWPSVFSNGVWHDSKNASWEVMVNSGQKVILKGSWHTLPIIQFWDLELKKGTNITCKIKKGAFVGITGLNGSGKTTFLYSLSSSSDSL